MGTINYILLDGSQRAVETSDGESLMRAALANDIDGIVGECGGEMSCATCHVYVGDAWRERLDPQSDDEIDLIELAESFRPEASRLGCQIRMCERLDGIEVEVAPGN